MTHPDVGAPTNLRASPRAAALAGILFSLLMGVAYTLLRMSIPADPAASPDWLEQDSAAVRLGLSLLPFAGIAFLWFIGVVRDRVGRKEDQLFSTVFFGSGLLFLGLLFVSAAIGAGLLATYARLPEEILGSGVYSFARELMYRISNAYAIRMAAVFMLSLGTISVRTRTMPIWLTVITYGAAAVLLFTLSYSLWVTLLFPAWVLLVSIYILVVNNLRGRNEVANPGTA